jgi:uncharacterized protein
MTEKFSALHMNNLVIHHADDDGFGAAWVCREYLNDQLRQGFGAHGNVPADQLGCEFIATNYGQPVPDVRGKHVTIVDFSYPRDVMISLIEQAQSLVVLDHHKSAQEALEGLTTSLPVEMAERAYIKFEDGKSGVLMAWEHFYGGKEPPELIGYLDAGDLWQLDRYDDLKQVQAALRSYPYDFKQWDHWMTAGGLDQLRAEGGAIRRFIEQKVAELLKTKHEIEVAGEKVMAVNAPWFLASEIAGSLAEQSEAGWGVCYYNNYDGKTFSLRSRGDVDVSEIAKKLGGGGHKGAAGFRVPRV